jgi:iron complex transport system ATP-binding protein
MDGMAIALVLHDLDLATRYCDALYLLHEGRLLASGSPDEVLTGHNLGEAFGIKAWHGVIDNHRCMVPLTAIANSTQIPGNH